MFFDTLMEVNGRERVVVEAVACCAPLAAPTLSVEEAEGTAELFRSPGDPARVRIVNVIATASEPVCACVFNEPVARGRR